MSFIVRWVPERSAFQNETFFGQSAFLHSHYHYLQVLIHRSFIPYPLEHGAVSSAATSTTARSLSPFPSLSICASAARRASQILDSYARGASKAGQVPPMTEVGLDISTDPGVAFNVPQHILFSVGVVLLFPRWIEQNDRDLAYVQQNLETLSVLEKRWNLGGRFWCVLLLFPRGLSDCLCG